MTSAPTNGTAPHRADPRNKILVIILTCYLLVVLDTMIMTTALPQIRDALGMSRTALSWTQNAYTLAFGGLLLLGARAGDLLGRRRVLTAGVGVFTAAALLGGLAQSPAWLVAARAVQGAGAAIIAPSSLALLMITFADGAERNRAMAYYGAVSGGGATIGLLVGGAFATAISWRWALFVNVPVGLVLLWLVPRNLTETPTRQGKFDLAGAFAHPAAPRLRRTAQPADVRAAGRPATHLEVTVLAQRLDGFAQGDPGDPSCSASSYASVFEPSA